MKKDYIKPGIQVVCFAQDICQTMETSNKPVSGVTSEGKSRDLDAETEEVQDGWENGLW